MEGLSPASPACHSADQKLIAEKRARLNLMIDKRHVHANDTTRSDIQMSHFGISHHACGQPHARPVCLQQWEGVLRCQLVVIRGCGKRDSITRASRGVTPTVY